MATKSSRKVVEVVHSHNGGWDLKEKGKAKLLAHFDKKADAEKEAKSLIRDATLAQIVIHGRNGRIQKEWTYGADPRNRKG